ncbi:MAG TPA: hypothetical protein VK425_03650, partial [Acidimicrobiales bacterium]|nr:hypothetical protein [Acidimicrobiales bacterium]
MAEPAVAAYGTWPSPIAASYSVEGSVGLGFPASASFGIVWEESRPDERGRVALVASGLSGTTELLPPEMSARTMAHEYGGRAWAVGGPGDERLVASNWEDQRLWDLTPGGAPRPLTPEAAEGTSLRYANPVISPDGAWVVAVREAHEPQGVVNDLVAVSLRQGGEPRILARGHDFYSFPALSADGRRLAFVSWDHPNMPWDSTQLWEAPFEDGALGELRPVAGQGTDESVVQPKWSVDGELFYISDRSGWWNLYQGSRSLAPLEQEFAGPAWTFGDSDYVLLGDGRVVATWGKGAEGHFGSLVGGSAVPQELPPYRSFKHVAPGPVGHDGQSVLAVAAGPRHSPAVVRINLEGGAEVLRQSEAREWPAEWVSVAEPFEFPTDGGVTGHGLYYAPRNPGFRPL